MKHRLELGGDNAVVHSPTLGNDFQDIKPFRKLVTDWKQFLT
ncbi:hypothetical protein SRABI121_00099 [Microbacterium sp. Bi121]|nr:hypothetical protein SRABI121_00099 [Microbacterium sp. Bi121]